MRYDVLPPKDITIDSLLLLLYFFFLLLKKKITKPCKWVGVWLCVFIFSKKKIKKNVNSCVMGWPNIICRSSIKFFKLWV